MSKENFKITAKEDGKEYWISRSLAVVGIVLTITEQNELKFLFEVRGPGCPDHVGKLAFPCGYLNWEETMAQAIKREVYEEIGLDVSKDEVVFWNIMDDPSRDERQNVSARFAISCDNLEERIKELRLNLLDTQSRGGEANEVSDIRLLGVGEIESLGEEEFAFNHKRLVQEFLLNLDEMGKRFFGA